MYVYARTPCPPLFSDCFNAFPRTVHRWTRSRRSFFKPETRNHFCVKSWMNRNRRVRFTSPPSHLLSTGSRLRKRRTKVDRGPRFREEPRRLEERLRKKPTVECHFELTPCSSNPFFPAGRKTPGFCTTCTFVCFSMSTRAIRIFPKILPESSSIQKRSINYYRTICHFINFSIVALSNISFLFSLFIVYFDIARIIFLGSRKFWNTNSECEREWEINV